MLWGGREPIAASLPAAETRFAARLTPLKSGAPVALVRVNFPTPAVEHDSVAIAPRPTSSGELVTTIFQYLAGMIAGRASVVQEVNIGFAIAVVLFMAQASCGRLGVRELRI
jgi:hypothetical protein